MRREELFRYQDSGSDPKGERTNESENEAQRRMAVQEVIDSPGYAILHTMFVQTIMEAENRLRDFHLSERQLRYEQGRIAAIADVQHRFVELAKTREEGEQSHG